MSKINIAVLSGNYFNTVSGLWQWDYGQILRIQGLDLPAAAEIHFSLQESGEAVRRIGITKDGVTDVVIPDFVLEGNHATRDYYAYAFIYLSNKESGETTHKIRMRITSRPKPEGYSESGNDTFAEILKAVGDALALKADKTDIVQADYSQNDKRALDYVKNRTHYEEIIEGSIVGMEFTVPFSNTNLSSTAGDLYEHNLNIPLQSGQSWSCIPIQNGNETTPIELEVKQDENGILYLGDANPKSNPNYGWRVDANSSVAQTLYVYEGRFYAVKIIGVSGTYTESAIHKLDEKFIPDTIARISDSVFAVHITAMSNDDGTYTYSADKTFDEIKAAYENGRYIYAVYADVIIPLEHYRSRTSFSFIRIDSNMGIIMIIISRSNTVRFIKEFLFTETTFNELDTTDETIVGAINEVNTHLEDKQDKTFIVTTNVAENEGKFSVNSIDKTFDEITEAYNSGKLIICKMINDGDGGSWYLSLESINELFVKFMGLSSNLRRMLMITSTNMSSYQTNLLLSVEGRYIDSLTTTDKTVLGAINEVNSTKLTAPSTASVGQVIAVKAVDENGKPTEWECVDETKPDWNQNDETAKDYLKNRPFYTTREDVVVLDETSIIIDESGQMILDSSPTLINELGIYIVNFDGVQYEVALFLISRGVVGLGNGSFIDAEGGEDEPFLITINHRTGECTVYASVGTHTLGITTPIETVHQLDEKYIPELPYMEATYYDADSGNEVTGITPKFMVDNKGAPASAGIYIGYDGEIGLTKSFATMEEFEPSYLMIDSGTLESQTFDLNVNGGFYNCIHTLNIRDTATKAHYRIMFKLENVYGSESNGVTITKCASQQLAYINNKLFAFTIAPYSYGEDLISLTLTIKKIL